MDLRRSIKAAIGFILLTPTQPATDPEPRVAVEGRSLIQPKKQGRSLGAAPLLTLSLFSSLFPGPAQSELFTITLDADSPGKSLTPTPLLAFFPCCWHPLHLGVP